MSNTQTDWRALVEGLISLVERCPVTSDADWIAERNELIVQFHGARRAALAQPEPEVAGPSDEEIIAFWSEHCAGDGDAGIIRLARYGRPAPAPAGELRKEAAWLRNECSAENAEGNWISMSIDQALDLADLLQRQAAPVPVPVAVRERLPGGGERDSDECCWWFHPETDDTLPVWVLGFGDDEWEIEKPPSPTHWLPAHAMPLPGGEVEP